jgi:serine/threonine protein kinase
MGHLRRTKRRSKNQRAGGFVGQGTYGCTYRPALKCLGEAKRRRGFSKLMKATDATKELTQRALLMPIDPTQQHFIYPVSECIPAARDASNIVPVDPGSRKTCTHDFRDTLSSRVIFQQDGGDDLMKIKLAPEEFLGFFRSFRGLMVGLQKIHAVGISHNDIKPLNIVSQKQPDGSFLTRFIDLGFMIKADTLNSEAGEEGRFPELKIFTKDYHYWSFEVRLVYLKHLMRAATPDINFINTELYYYYTNFEQMRATAPVKKLVAPVLTLADVNKMGLRYSAMSNADRYASIFSGSDIHALGLTIAQMYLHFIGHRDRGIESPDIVVLNERDNVWQPVSGELAGYSPEAAKWHRTVAYNISVPFYTMIRRMIHGIPTVFAPDARTVRATADEIIATYDTILPQMEKYFTADSLRSFVKPFMGPMAIQTTPRPFELSPLQEEPDRRPPLTPRPPELSPLLEEPLLPESTWTVVGPKRRGGSRRTLRRHRR